MVRNPGYRTKQGKQDKPIKKEEDKPVNQDYPGRVITPELFSPSALKKTDRGTFIEPPTEQVTGRVLPTPQEQALIQAQENVSAQEENMPKGTSTIDVARAINQAGDIRNLPPEQQAAFLGGDVQPAQPDILDISKVVGAGVAGAGTGATIGTLAGPVGTIAGAVLGGIAGAGTALFYTSATERKQQVKVSFTDFKESTKQMQNLINDVNAGNITKQKAREYWDEEYQRVLKAEREIRGQQSKLYGEKLSKSLDELSKIEAWKRRYGQFNLDFERALAAPDPTNIRFDIAETSLEVGE